MPTRSMPLTGAGSAHTLGRMCISAWLIPAGLDLDDHMAGSGRRLRDVLEDKAIHPAQFLENDGTHGRSPT
jgi:hypothetical protein